MTELLARGTVVLDGGLSNALENRGHDLSSALWTARLLRDDPGEIVAVHRAYFAAGARVATTASYQASVPGLVAAGASHREAEALITASVRLAREARDQAAPHTEVPLFVAASVGPYGAARANGSEYQGRYGRTAAQLRAFHGPRLELLAAAGPDLLAVETIPTPTRRRCWCRCSTRSRCRHSSATPWRTAPPGPTSHSHRRTKSCTAVPRSAPPA